MEDDKLQLDMGVQEGTAPEMTDDDIAATLGLMTTIGEQGMMPQEEEEEGTEEAPEAPKQPQEESKSAGVDSEQDKEIKAIREELESLKEEISNEQETENTGVTQ